MSTSIHYDQLKKLRINLIKGIIDSIEILDPMSKEETINYLKTYHENEIDFHVLVCDIKIQEKI